MKVAIQPASLRKPPALGISAEEARALIRATGED
jgi:hypothetical protein